jgi:hypothetical protein
MDICFCIMYCTMYSVYQQHPFESCRLIGWYFYEKGHQNVTLYGIQLYLWIGVYQRGMEIKDIVLIRLVWSVFRSRNRSQCYIIILLQVLYEVCPAPEAEVCGLPRRVPGPPGRDGSATHGQLWALHPRPYPCLVSGYPCNISNILL